MKFDIDNLDTSRIEAMSREELEMNCVKCAAHLAEGVVLMESANLAIRWLADAAYLLGTHLIAFAPEITEETKQLLEKVQKYRD